MKVTVCLKYWLNSLLHPWFSDFKQIAKKACFKKKCVYPCILICHLNPQNLSLGSKIVGLGVTAGLTTSIYERWSHKLQKDKERGRELKWGTYASSFLKEKCSALRFFFCFMKALWSKLTLQDGDASGQKGTSTSVGLMHIFRWMFSQRNSLPYSPSIHWGGGRRRPRYLQWKVWHSLKEWTREKCNAKIKNGGGASVQRSWEGRSHRGWAAQ